GHKAVGTHARKLPSQAVKGSEFTEVQRRMGIATLDVGEPTVLRPAEPDGRVVNAVRGRMEIVEEAAFKNRVEAVEPRGGRSELEADEPVRELIVATGLSAADDLGGAFLRDRGRGTGYRAGPLGVTPAGTD